MKKKLSFMLALTCIMTMMFGTTVMAATSVSTTNSNVTSETLQSQADTTTATVEGTVSGKVTIQKVSTVTYDSAVKAVDNTGVIKTIVDVVLEGATDAEKANGIKVTVKVPGLDASKTYVFLHQKADGSWEEIPATMNADGSLTGTFKGLSPVAVVEKVSTGAAAPAPAAPAASAASANPATSPKTADTSAMPYVAMMVALCGAAFLKKAKAF